MPGQLILPPSSSPGGGSEHSPIVRAFPFTFDTAGILTGAAVYTPTVGDILHDAWIEIDTAWDGTTPMADVGTFDGGFGWFADWNAPIDVTQADDQDPLGLLNNQTGLVSPSLATYGAAFVSGTTVTVGRVAPGKLVSADPIRVAVSQNGSNTGADPGSTVGAATLYLVTSTPLLPA